MFAAGLFDGSSAGRGALYTQDAILLATQAVIIDEELFEFLLELPAKILDVLHVRVAVVGALDGDDSVVANAFLAPTLFAFDDPDHSRRELAAGKGGLVHERDG
jgi:hypothetical protein